MSRSNFIWYLFSLFLIVTGALSVFAGYPRDGYQIIALGAVIAAILTLTGRPTNG